MNGHEIFVGVDAATQRLQNLTMSALIRELREIATATGYSGDELQDWLAEVIVWYDPEASDE